MDAFYYAFPLRTDLADLFGLWIPLVLLKDSMSLFNQLIHTSTAGVYQQIECGTVTTEKRLMIDIAALHEDF